MVRKIAAAVGFAKMVRRLCSNTSPTMPTGIVPTTSSHAIRSAGVSMWRLRIEEKNPLIDSHPVAPEEDEQRDRGGDVQADEEREIERLVCRLAGDELVPAEQLGQQHRVAEARDREQLGDALHDPDHDRLQVRQRCSGERHHRGSSARWWVGTGAG